MDGITLQSKIDYGRGRAAAKIGRTYGHYRPTGTGTVITPTNKIGTLNAIFNVGGGYSKPNTYGQATWQGVLDASQVNVGDYLDGPEGPFFIAAKQPLLPVLAVGCSRVVSLTQGGTTPVAVGWPASILLESPRGESGLEDIPGNPSAPHWWCLLPAVPGLTLDVADLVTDDLLRQYFVSAAELTSLGWRISLMQTTLLSNSVIQHYATIIGLIGKVITLRKYSRTGSPNPVVTHTDYSVKALIQGYDLALVANSTVGLTDQRVIIGTMDIGGSTIPAPAATDALVIDGAVRSIISAKIEYAGDTVAVYDIQAKG